MTNIENLIEIIVELSQKPYDLTPHEVASILRGAGRPVGDSTVIHVHQILVGRGQVAKESTSSPAGQVRRLLEIGEQPIWAVTDEDKRFFNDHPLYPIGTREVTGPSALALVHDWLVGQAAESEDERDHRETEPGGIGADYADRTDHQHDWLPMVTIDYHSDPKIQGTAYRLRSHTTGREVEVDDAGEIYGVLSNAIEDAFDGKED